MRPLLIACFLPLAILLGCGVVAEPDPRRASARSAFEIDPAFFALGALYEYTGYCLGWPGDAIDTFDAGERPQAIVFARYLERLAQERGVETDIALRKGQSGCIVVASLPMKDILASLFPGAPAGDEISFEWSAVPGQGPTYASSSYALFGDLAAKRSYLAGVYLRFHESGVLSFANSAHKVSLVRVLLNEAGCTDVEVSKTPRGHYPINYSVTYTPSAEIASLFERVEQEVQNAQR